MWLRDTIDGTMYFPEADGQFAGLESSEMFTTLAVESRSIVHTTSLDCLQPTTSAVLPPAFKSVIACKKGTLHNIKVRQ